MLIGRFRFSPPVWAVFVLFAGLCLFIGLGIWQIQRGENKQSALAQRQAASRSEAVSFIRAMQDSSRSTPDYGHRYIVRGRMDSSQQILFDNQVHQGRIGYRVWTPVVLGDGARVLVDRGWVPLGPDGRRTPPNPDGPAQQVEVTGFWRSLPQPGLRLGQSGICDADGWPRVLNYPTIADLRCQYDGPVIDGLLLLDESDDRGFARNWDQQFVRMPPMRHYAYALQWFAMALALAVIFVGINLRRDR